MFGWLVRMFRRPPPDRRIFRYRDGTRDRSADPTEIEVRMADALGDDWRARVRDYGKPTPASIGVVGEDLADTQAHKKKERAAILAAIDAAFEVEPYTDARGTAKAHGLTAAERFGLLEGYERFCLDLMVLARPFLRPWPRGSPGGPEPPPSSSGPESSSGDTGSPSDESTTPPAPSAAGSAA